jgi:hypothetical protein
MGNVSTTLTVTMTANSIAGEGAQDRIISLISLPAGGKDAAVLVRLPPGGYTVIVSGIASGTGIALVEIYDLDP